MKKLHLIIVFCILTVSCKDEIKIYNISITNNSTKSVSYTYNGSSDSLAVSETKKYEVKAYTGSPQNLVDQNGIASVELNVDNLKGDYFIVPAPEPINLSVTNTLPIEVSIRAGNFIDDSGSPIFTISANSEKSTAKIYTKNPIFTSLISYPIIIDWNRRDDTIYMVIR